MTRVRVLGISLTGPPPIGRVHFELTPGLTALYGVNGSGKSTVLEGLAAALSGQAPRRGGRAEVHLAVDDIDRSSSDGAPDGLIQGLLIQGTNAIEDELRAMGGPPVRPSEFGLDETLVGGRPVGSYLQDEGSLGAAVRAWLLWLAEGDPSGASHGIAREIASQGLFTLRATGTDEPSWQVFISAHADEAYPLVSQTLHGQRQRWIDHNLDPANHLSPLDPTAFDDAAFYADDLRHDVGITPEPPAWLPYPVALWGFLGPWLSDWPPLVLREGVDPVAETERMLDASAPRDSADLVSAMESDDLLLSDWARDAIALVERRANEHYETLQRDPPTLKCDVLHPRRWTSGTRLQWHTEDALTGESIGVVRLGDMHRRWAEFSIVVAAREVAREGRPPAPRVESGDRSGTVGAVGLVGVIDEPERASHPLALRHLEKGLVQMAGVFRCPVVVATHSTEFLGDPAVRLAHVNRGPTVSITRMPEDWRTGIGLTDLGLTPGDLLQTVRVFLIVEGEHDVAVLQGLLGDELDTYGVRLLAARGIRGATGIIDAQLLMDFTDAAVVVCFDNVRSDRARGAWDRVRMRLGSSAGSLRSQRQALEEIAYMKDGSGEEQALYELCRRAIERRSTSRVSITGLQERDIIQYLPVHSFLSDASSWDEAVAEWNHQGDFKGWLRDRGAVVSASRLRQVAGAMDEIPEDISAVWDTCRVVGTPR